MMRFHPLSSPTRLRIVCLLVTTCFAVLALTAIPLTRTVSSQVPSADKPSRLVGARPAPKCLDPTPQTIYAPTIGLPEVAGGKIVFNSRSDVVMEVHPTFYTDEGATVEASVVSLQPAEIRTVNIASLIPAAQRGRTRWGGISLSYTGKVFDVWAQITLLGAGHAGSTDVTFSVLNGRGSNVQDAVWWMPPGSRAVLALGNSSSTALQTNLQFSNGDSQIVHIAPYATEYVRLRARGGNNTHELVDGGGESVRVNTEGPDGSLKAVGLVAAADGRLLSSIRFYDTPNVGQPHLFATNMKLRGYAPRIVLKNTSATTISAQPRFRPAAGEDGQPVELAPVTLRPGEIAELNLHPLMSAAAGRTDLDSVSVQIINSGAAGSLIGALNGVALQTNATYDVPLRDPGPNRSNSGAYPWRIDGDFSTVASVTNVGDTPSRFIAELYYPSGRYLFGPRPLAVGQTAFFDLKQIRDQRLPDANGDVLPAGVTSGQFRWRWYPGPHAPHMIGRAAVVSRSQGISASYSCMANCGANGPSYLIDGFSTVLAGDYEMLNTREQWCGASGGCNVYDTNISGSMNDPTIASLENMSTGWLKQNGLNTGETFWWFSYWYGYEYDDGYDCRYAQDEVNDIEPVRVIPVRFTSVVQEFGSARFIEDPTGGTYRATLNLPSYSRPCAGIGFPMKVYLDKGTSATLYGHNDPRIYASAESDGQYRIGGGGLVNETTNRPEFSIAVQRINPGNINKSLRFGVAGYTQSGGFSVTASLTISCQ